MRRHCHPYAMRGILAALLAGLILAVAACQPVTIPQGSELGVTVDEIVADPQRFIGNSVSAEAQVDRIVSEQVIALRGQSTAQNVLAIVGDQSLKGIDSVQPGDTLHIVGVVQLMSREQLRQVEQQLGIQLDEERLLNLANQAPFLVVQKVTK